MAVYDSEGNALTAIYDADGNSLQTAYDAEGNVIYRREMTVMSYNVQWLSGLNSNQTMQRLILDTYDADIIGIQEWTQLGTTKPTDMPLFSDYNYSYLGIQTNKTALVSKPVLTDVVGHVFENQGNETKGYQTAWFNYGDKDIFWVNAHMFYDDRSVIAPQCEEIFDIVQDKEYFIITGDFNVLCKSTSSVWYTECMKQFIDAGYNSANCSEQHGFLDTWTGGKDTSGTWYCLDQIITSPNLEIIDVVVDQTKLNYLDGTNAIDHLPIIARLRIT